MTGIDFGFGSLILYSLLFLLLVPSITIILINQFNCFIKLKIVAKSFLNIIFFIFFAYFTLLIIRTFHTSSFNFLLSYVSLITVIIFTKRLSKKAKL
jgi:hypothetical protein